MIRWLRKNFQVTEVKNGEALMVCPSCHKTKLYFNVIKKIGHCHYDKCKFHINGVRIDSLVDIAGDRYDDLPSWDDDIVYKPEQEPVEITLPETAKPIVTLANGFYMTQYPDAINALDGRGVTVESAYRFGLHIDLDRVYIPVYQGGVLRQYVGRAIWWLPQQSDLRYKYAKGINIKKFLFNYDTVKHWDRVTLVENTFNGIWLRDLKFTSNFGSTLSDEQIQLIACSKIKSVALLWDEGSEASAEKSVKRLTKAGIPASFGLIYKQPDNHEFEWLGEMSDLLHNTSKPWLDLTGR